jgi:predicted TIM-barrel fold metal-dependent hydrolase
MERLIVVSGDSHAGPPPELWPEYVEAKYHDLLPAMYEDNERFKQLFGLFANFSPEALEVMDTDGVWASGGYEGAWDVDRRLTEMDREGIAVELVYPGDQRALIPLAPHLRKLPQDAVAAGARAYNRWAADTFAAVSDRFLLVGDPACGTDIDDMVAEVDWMAEHGFVGAYPGFWDRPDLPVLYDPYFDPYWSRCAERGLAVVIHAGYGSTQSELFTTVEALRESMEAAGRHDLLAEIVNNGDRFFRDLRPRRAMWRLMLGGVFDRHPKLKLVMTEVRGDWLPDTLQHLDEAFEEARGDLPARRRASEYWQESCLVALSFVHKAEVAMRHEIGVQTVCFGRDYPHAEGTWPNTADWLSDAFADVPDDELRLVLGENAIRVLGLERTKLAAVAERIGPTVGEIRGRGAPLDPRLIANWDVRSGYLKPREEFDRDGIDELLAVDIAHLASMKRGQVWLDRL